MDMPSVICSPSGTNYLKKRRRYEWIKAATMCHLKQSTWTEIIVQFANSFNKLRLSIENHQDLIWGGKGMTKLSLFKKFADLEFPN